jgi:hypothetical protein
MAWSALSLKDGSQVRQRAGILRRRARRQEQQDRVLVTARHNPPQVFRHTERAHEATPDPRVAARASITGECGTKRFCKQMTTFEEARYFFKFCGVKQVDGDGDGRPCEVLCR